VIVGYARVSTVGQNLYVQIEQLESYCEKIFKEKISGAKSERPELEAMLDFVREGDQVVCCKLDRIARSTKHLLGIVEQLEKKGVAFKVLNINLDTGTPTGKLMLTMLAGIAQFEREMMLERQAEGIARAKREGRFNGRPRIIDGKVEQIKEMLAQGFSKAQIARELNIGEASVYRALKRDNCKFIVLV